MTVWSVVKQITQPLNKKITKPLDFFFLIRTFSVLLERAILHIWQLMWCSQGSVLQFSPCFFGAVPLASFTFYFFFNHSMTHQALVLFFIGPGQVHASTPCDVFLQLCSYCWIHTFCTSLLILLLQLPTLDSSQVLSINIRPEYVFPAENMTTAQPFAICQCYTDPV